MNRNQLLLVPLLCGGFVILGSATAAPPPRAAGTRPIDRLVSLLELSAEKEKRVRELEQQRQTTVRPLRKRLRVLQAELVALWEAATPSRAAIAAKQTEIASAQAAMRAARLDFRLAVHALLTPEQRARFVEHVAGKPAKHAPRAPEKAASRGSQPL